MPAFKPAYLTSKNVGEDAGMAGQEAGATALSSGSITCGGRSPLVEDDVGETEVTA